MLAPWVVGVGELRRRIGHDRGMDYLIEAGFGLDYDTLHFTRTTEQSVFAGTTLCDIVTIELAGLVTCVELIGSSSVVGLLAKPIVDLAAGLSIGHNLTPVRAALEHGGWIYRGDAGDDGGHVFVLETRPCHRVAHLHVVAYESRQWKDYLQLRDLLRGSPAARAKYEAVKQQLRERVGDDREAYTEGKSAIVQELLSSLD